MGANQCGQSKNRPRPRDGYGAGYFPPGGPMPPPGPPSFMPPPAFMPPPMGAMPPMTSFYMPPEASMGSRVPTPVGSFIPPPVGGSFIPPPVDGSFFPPPVGGSFIPPPAAGSYIPPTTITTHVHTPINSYIPPAQSRPEDDDEDRAHCDRARCWTGKKKSKTRSVASDYSSAPPGVTPPPPPMPGMQGTWRWIADGEEYETVSSTVVVQPGTVPMSAPMRVQAPISPIVSRTVTPMMTPQHSMTFPVSAPMLTPQHSMTFPVSAPMLTPPSSLSFPVARPPMSSPVVLSRLPPAMTTVTPSLPLPMVQPAPLPVARAFGQPIAQPIAQPGVPVPEPVARGGPGSQLSAYYGESSPQSAVRQTPPLSNYAPVYPVTQRPAAEEQPVLPPPEEVNEYEAMLEREARAAASRGGRPAVPPKPLQEEQSSFFDYGGLPAAEPAVDDQLEREAMAAQRREYLASQVQTQTTLPLPPERAQMRTMEDERLAAMASNARSQTPVGSGRFAAEPSTLKTIGRVGDDGRRGYQGDIGAWPSKEFAASPPYPPMPAGSSKSFQAQAPPFVSGSFQAQAPPFVSGGWGGVPGGSGQFAVAAPSNYVQVPALGTMQMMDTTVFPAAPTSMNTTTVGAPALAMAMPTSNLMATTNIGAYGGYGYGTPYGSQQYLVA